MEKFVDAAKKRFGGTEIGTDLQQFTIPYREEDEWRSKGRREGPNL
jgi:hypothetical protein